MAMGPLFNKHEFLVFRQLLEPKNTRFLSIHTGCTIAIARFVREAESQRPELSDHWNVVGDRFPFRPNPTDHVGPYAEDHCCACFKDRRIVLLLTEYQERFLSQYIGETPVDQTSRHRFGQCLFVPRVNPIPHTSSFFSSE